MYLPRRSKGRAPDQKLPNHERDFNTSIESQGLRAAAMLLLGINIGRIIYLYHFVSLYDVLWVSQYIGVIGGLSLFFKLRNELLNGAYAFAFLLPLVGLFTSRSTDILFYLNHLPHVIGIAYLIHPRIRYSRVGQLSGLAFVLAMIGVTFGVDWAYGPLQRNINGVGDSRLPVLLFTLVVWFAIVDRLRVAKLRRAS